MSTLPISVEMNWSSAFRFGCHDDVWIDYYRGIQEYVYVGIASTGSCTEQICFLKEGQSNSIQSPQFHLQSIAIVTEW